MFQPVSNEFGLIISSIADGTPASATFGAAVTPGNNAYGAVVQLISGANLTSDVCEIEINVNSVGITTTARDGMIQLGIDPAGGTSPTITYDLPVGPASPYNNAGGVWLRFPLLIKAGSGICVAASVNSATATAIRVSCRVKCSPSRPDLIRVGQYLDVFGVVTASSSGTAITSGGGADGAWTQIGVALTRPLWWLEFAFGCNNAVMNATGIHVDIGIGDATNKKIVIANHYIVSNASESLSKASAGCYVQAAVGDILYARSQAQAGVTDAGQSVAIFGVGG